MSNNTYAIQNLRKLSKTSNTMFGSKAANLGELMNSGIRVPQGFALSYKFYEHYLEHNRINYSPKDYLGLGLEIREQILAGDFQEGFREELAHNFDELKAKSGCTGLAVRSSSVLEDGELYSMAGMFESYLKLNTFEEVVETVKKCYASLFSDKVLHFMFDNNIGFEKLKMGVIVQEFIAGKPSGVIFSADTVNMDEHKIQINAVDSVCAEYVNGALPSSLFSVDKAAGDVIAVDVSDNSPALDLCVLNKLTDLAIRIEELFGCYQDIEWTVCDDDIFILQARPVTTFREMDFKIVWENDRDSEYTWYSMMPAPYTPLMQDIIRIEIEELGQGAYETAFRIDTYGECAIHNGYVYLREKPIKDIDEKRQLLLRKLDELTSQGKCVFNDVILPDILTLIESLNKCAGKKLCSESAIEYLNMSMEYLKMTWRQHWMAVQVNEFLFKFEEYFLKTFDDMGIQEFYDLVYMPSLLNRERELLFLMLMEVRSNTLLKNMFDSFQYDEILYARLLKTPEAEKLLSLINQYVSEFGLCDSGLDCVLHPVLMERPDYAIGQVRSILNVDETVFFKSQNAALPNKEKVKQIIRQRLTPAEYQEFLNKLSLAEKAFITNDNHNYYMERMYRGYVRLASMEAGRLLCGKDVLADPEDIQFLYFNEIISILNGEGFNKEIVEKRKEEYAFQKKLQAPEIIGNVPQPAADAADKEAAGNMSDSALASINGVSGLKARVKGTVYVGMPEVLEEDRILVLPHCHCGDIFPLLNKVKGLIFNWGSPYDHPAIIAREMNIPAIYKTNNATDVLATGDEVEMDGYTGVVNVLTRAGSI